MLRDFEVALGARLQEYTGTTETPQNLSRIARLMFSGLGAAVEGTYGTAAHSAAPGHLRPLEIDGRAVLAHLRKARVHEGVSARRRGELSGALERAVAAVLDPTEDFGNELLRLLTVGNILQGLLSARDVARVRVAEGTRILLDTPTLVNVAETDTAGHRLFEELVGRSQATGVEIHVALHTLEEYEGLWVAADAELEGYGATELDQLSESRALVDNPLVREYLRMRAEVGELSWQRFQVGKRAIRQWLTSRGITVCHHENESAECRRLADEIQGKLLELSDIPHTKASRTPKAAAADAQSCAMVARWRQERPHTPPSAWFVGRDRLTGRAYRQITSDEYPLAVTPESWVLYLSNLGAEDQDVRSLAVTLGDVAARQHLLSVAAGYTTADVLRLASILSEDGSGLSKPDLHKAVQLDLLKLLREPDEEQQGKRDVRELADRVLRDRSHRRDVRAQRAEQEAARKGEQIDDRIASEREEAQAAERMVGEARLLQQRERMEREAEERAAAQAADADRRRLERERQLKEEKVAAVKRAEAGRRRERRAVVSAAMFIAFVVGIAQRWGGFSDDARLLAVCVGVLLVGELVLYVSGKIKNAWWLVGSVVLIAAGLGADLAVSNLWGG